MTIFIITFSYIVIAAYVLIELKCSFDEPFDFLFCAIASPILLLPVLRVKIDEYFELKRLKKEYDEARKRILDEQNGVGK